MASLIEDILDKFEAGQVSRREFIARLTALMSLAGVGGLLAQNATSIPAVRLDVSEINHIAIRVTDLERAQKFYEEVLGMKLLRKLRTIRFMGCGRNFVALFKSSEPGLDHLAFTLPEYEQSQVVAKLMQLGLSPQTEESRVYFTDPEGYQIQLEHPEAWPGPGRRPQ